MPPSIVITGASTGIGFACALDLDKRGYRVFAGVRKSTDAQRLKESGSKKLTPVFIDVTDPNSIAKTAAIVSESLGNSGLDALLNNAGIVIAGPLEYLQLSHVKKIMEVNVIGQITVTQAFLPFLRKARGRIINMSSLAGYSASPIFGLYNASKFALEAISDTLRVELRPWGIDVILVEPGAILTPLWAKSNEKINTIWKDFPDSAFVLYGNVMEHTREVLKQLETKASPVSAVTKAVYRSLKARRPKARYVVGPEARSRLLLEKLPVRIRDRILARWYDIK